MNKITFKEDIIHCLKLIKKDFFINKITIEIENIEGLNYYRIFLYKPYTKQLRFSEGFITQEEIIEKSINSNLIEFTIFNFLKYNKKNFYKKFTLDVE